MTAAPPSSAGDVLEYALPSQPMMSWMAMSDISSFEALVGIPSSINASDAPGRSSIPMMFIASDMASLASPGPMASSCIVLYAVTRAIRLSAVSSCISAGRSPNAIFRASTSSIVRELEAMIRPIKYETVSSCPSGAAAIKAARLVESPMRSMRYWTVSSSPSGTAPCNASRSSSMPCWSELTPSSPPHP